MPRRWAVPILSVCLLAASFLAQAATSCFAAGSRAQADASHPRLVRVTLPPETSSRALLEAGLDVIELKPDHGLILEWPGDELRLAALGGRVEVVDSDPERTAAERARSELAARPRPAGTRVISAVRPDGIFRAETLPPFGSGSMGGYWTLDEVKMKLDQLVADDLVDVVADKLDTVGYSIQGRPIWGLKLGKSVTGPDSRPVAFFNALTHAREPEGMQALLYFVDDLLSNYGTDPTATYMLDHRVIYVVPVVNPDGYYRNQFTNPMGGGFWRKNLRDNNNSGTVDSNDGVDLNRNYSYQWGYNNTGSSGSPGAATYRGTAPFSEPETQAQRDLIAALQPKTGLSFHTYGDLLLHAWGYTMTPSPDSDAFYEWSDDLSLGVSYQSGEPPRVLYEVNGEFNDWCYGDVQLKPRAFTWTPEVGTSTDGFWPAPSRIVPLAQENLRHCYLAASIAGPWVRVENSALAAGNLGPGWIGHLSIRARNKGASGTAGPGLTGTLSTLSAGANVTQPTVAYPSLGSFQSGDPLSGQTFVVSADDTVTLGRLLRFRVDFSAPDGFFSRDTIEILCGFPTVQFADNASNGLGSWTPGSWGIESLDPSHPGPYFADSPGSVYGSSADNALTLGPTLALAPGVHAYLLYEARWDFESDVDCGLIEATTNGATWVPLATAGSTRASGAAGSVQPAGQPVYDGTRHRWRAERADLSAFMGGSAPRIRFRVRSNSGNGFAGLDVDSIRVVIFDPAAQPAPVAIADGPVVSKLELALPTPNPARQASRLEFAVPRDGPVRLEILDLQGRRVRLLTDGRLRASRYVRGWDLTDDRGHRVAAGVYVARLVTADEAVSRRVVALP
jgi:hypothetical protein